MMAERWRDVRSDLASSQDHYREAIGLFRANQGHLTLQERYVEVMAFQHAMQSGYTSFESAIRRLFALIDEPLPQGSDWHAILLRRISQPQEGSRPAIIGPELADAADELMRFRHVAMHAYDRFSERKAAIAVEAAETFLAHIDGEFAAFRAAIDPD